MTEERKRRYHRIITDCWRLFLKFQDPVDGQEYWERLNSEAREIAERHGSSDPFVRESIYAVLNEIDRIWRKESP